MKNKGEILAQKIVAITIIGILIGVVCPFGLRVAEKTQRMRDVYEANEIAHQFQLMTTYYGGFPCDVNADAEGDTYVVDWQKEEMMEASGLTEEQIIEAWAELDENGQYYLDKLLFSYLEKIPESSTNPDYAWNLHYDVDTGTVESILLVEENSSGDIISKMEVYPNYSDFIKFN